MWVTKQLTAAIDLFFPHTWRSIGTNNCLVTNILQNVFFCVQQKREIHMGLERHEGKSQVRGMDYGYGSALP